jgi:NAD(P)-dependent dehydrogenase (short-subunit alcohol dehydrogenase family)
MAGSDMAGKVVVVTGASSGIGAAAARELHRMGAEVHAVGRDPIRTTEVAAELGTTPILADFASLDDVHATADEVLDGCGRLDVLVNNAALSVSRREETVDGHELMFQVNHLAPFLLTARLLDLLVDSGPSRVVTTSSAANLFGFVRVDDLESTLLFVGPQVYGTTKLENILFTRELARRYGEQGVLATSFDPGLVATRFGRGDVSGILQRSPLRRVMRTSEAAADTLVWLASAPRDGIRGGYFYRDRRPGIMNPQGRSNDVARRLWDRSAELVGTE